MTSCGSRPPSVTIAGRLHACGIPPASCQRWTALARSAMRLGLSEQAAIALTLEAYYIQQGYAFRSGDHAYLLKLEAERVAVKGHPHHRYLEGRADLLPYVNEEVANG